MLSPARRTTRASSENHKPFTFFDMVGVDVSGDFWLDVKGRGRRNDITGHDITPALQLGSII
jgi:hypothetical protein